jgi:hypothetical protein
VAYDILLHQIQNASSEDLDALFVDGGHVSRLNNDILPLGKDRAALQAAQTNRRNFLTACVQARQAIRTH